MIYLHNFLSAPASFIGDYLLPFVVVLSVLIFIHECGHYLVARFFGVRVEVFSIGLGREIVGWTDSHGTRWKISLLPIGGYVQMFGDADAASATAAKGVEESGRIRPLTEQEKRESHHHQSVGRRAAIAFAGPAINFIFAILLMTGLFAVHGQSFTAPVAAAVVEGGAADKAGIRPGDKIIEINGTSIQKFQQIVNHVSVGLGSDLSVKILRSTGKGQWSNKPISLRLTPAIIDQTDRFGFKHQVGRIGISSAAGQSEAVSHTLGSAFVAALTETWNISAGTLKAIGQMILGTRSADELGGVLRIGAYAGEFAQQGVVALILFTALLSVNLGLINLLPIPILDGGHLVFYALEAIKGGPLGEKFQERALQAGMAFLLAIMIFATWNDLSQMKVFEYVKSLIS